MKKNHYLSMLLLAIGLQGNAQQSFGESFIPGNFALGNIDGQNGWLALTSQGNPFGGCSVSDEQLDEWTIPNMLKLAHDPNFTASEGLDFFCFSPSLVDAPFQFVQGSGSVMFYIQPDSDSQTTGANYAVQFDDGEHVTGSVLFLNDGSIAVADKINGVLQWAATAATWMPGEWKQLNIYVNMQAGTLRYNIQGEDIYTGNTLNGNSLAGFSVRYDNQPGSVAYFDNLLVFGSNQVLGTGHNEIAQFQLYPNPAKDALTITGVRGRTAEPLKIYAIDGRSMMVASSGAAGDTETVDISSLAQGNYIIGIPTENGLQKRKFIKQ